MRVGSPLLCRRRSLPQSSSRQRRENRRCHGRYCRTNNSSRQPGRVYWVRSVELLIPNSVPVPSLPFARMLLAFVSERLIGRFYSLFDRPLLSGAASLRRPLAVTVSARSR
ncbi:hypothetical protein L596_002229 [Steinernema carpocapsae]|uniref:Uncharacterized protein n=1 Tax=Steinernema carpocapsae TaxID=34508 RepID=A0A4U8UNW7_STECR|nr:hypothetical protein L596_002229 [Steinernema carpocapsae]